MAQFPSITVLLPVYNADDTLKDTIDSILNQTFKDFELLVINDGSSDMSEEIILSYNDKRIIYVKNNTNIGLIKTLNLGITLSRGKYIARMDADDIMMPLRLKCQYSFMEKNIDVAVCGGAYERFGNSTGVYYPPKTDEDIRVMLLLGSPIPHPTAFIRRQVLEKFNIKYNEKYLHIEDYKFWYDLSLVGKLVNLKQILIKYRVSKKQISFKHNSYQDFMARELRSEIVNNFLSLYGLKLDKMINYSTILNLVKEFDLLNNYNSDKRFSCILFVVFMSIKEHRFKALLFLLKSKLWLNSGFKFKYIAAIILLYMGNKKLRRYSL